MSFIVSVLFQDTSHLAALVSITNFASALCDDTSGDRMVLLAASKRAVQGQRSASRLLNFDNKGHYVKYRERHQNYRIVIFCS